ncbi:SGNH/GDSL hydrolase family protein [Nocardioides aquaticus]|uniref:SGNH/GDSL hydrolase family protein n=1 Tax=Nocardioides aquaticus TaxID=160826 RepID=UPI001BD3EF4E|nr:SGNH/GDSL hydrolase family protein [Nocardioides aquaticus]
MTATEPDWDTSTGRTPGPAMRLLNAVVPGVRRVRAQVDRYAAAWRDHNARAVREPRRRWVVLGDSMSQGVGASAHDAGWVGQLDQRLRADGHDLAVLNLSATGARTRDVLDRQLPVLESLPTQPDGTPAALVTVLVGSNDLFGGREARAALPSAMAELVDRLPAGSLVPTLPQPSAAADLANEHVVRAAARGRVVLVDLRETGPTSWRGRLAPDFFHPNDLGYAAMADALEPGVRAVLRAGQRG